MKHPNSKPKENLRQPSGPAQAAKTDCDVASVKISHPDRVIFPDAGITKAQLAGYYNAVAERILPEIAGRPLSLLRCPAGMAGACFFQKHFATGMKRLHRVTIEEKHVTGDYLTVRDARDLVALVQEGVVEIHPWGAKADDPDRPDRVIFDLDPGPRVEWSSVMDTAKALRAHLEQLDLVSFLKTTGGKGLHVVVPVRRGPAWSEIKAFSRAVAGAFVKADPSAYTISPAKRGRERKIFIDYLRNDRGATAVAAYAVRARAKAPVATPLAWDELKAGLEVDSFTLLTVPGRLAALRKNPWSGIEKLRQSISPQARRALGLR